MQALAITAPSSMSDTTEVQDLPEPAPGPGQVSIDVAAAGINFVDVIARRGDSRYAADWPHRPGHEVAGRVRAVGARVEGLAAGQRVAALTPAGGGLAEVAIADARLVVSIPDGVAFVAAATAPAVLSTAVLLLTDAGHWHAGESVLMHSASGGVGSAVAQVLAALGDGPRIGTVGHADKVDDARRRGWDVVLVRDDGLADAIRTHAPDGVDLILDPLGGSSIERGLEFLAPLGRIVAFGNAAGEPPSPLPPHGRLMGWNVAVAGLSISALSQSAPARVADAIRRGLDLLAERRVDLDATVLDGLDEVAQAHQLLADGRGSGKYVVSIAGTHR